MSVGGISLRIIRKPIRNLYIRVTPPQGEVNVSAPIGMADERITSFITQRYRWIIMQRERLRLARANGLSGSNLPDLNPAGEHFVWTQEHRGTAASRINSALPGLLARWSDVIGRQPSHITLRVMSSRWGSCTPTTGRIRLNLQLGLMDDQFLEYVLVHEMTHLWVSGHGPAFKQRMTAYLPQWRAVRRALNRQVIW